MTRRRHSYKPHGLFFVTTSTLNHIVRFENPSQFQFVMENIELYRIRDCASIHGYIIMPNHFHLLIGIPEGKSISAFMRDLKKRIAYEFFTQNNLPTEKFWQERFDSFDITSEDTFYIKLNYIHYNPVRKGWVDKPEDWEYSSARFYLTGCQEIIQVTPI